MNILIQAAAIRALRTLIQGLLGGGLLTAVVAIVLGTGDQSTRTAALASAATIIVTALASFLQGVLAGLPEAEPTESTLDALIGLAHNQGVSLSSATTDEDAVAALIAYKPKVTRKTA